MVCEEVFRGTARIIKYDFNYLRLAGARLLRDYLRK